MANQKSEASSGSRLSLAGVTATPLNPDALDIALLREMYRGGAVNITGIDPRLNATRMASHLRVGRARVAARLKAWSDSGLLVRYEVWLNPALIGWRGAAVNIRVEHPRAKPGLLSHLGMVEGAVLGMEFLGDWVTVALVIPDEAALERRVALIRGLSGVKEVEEPILWPILEPKRQLSSLDIRIVRALRERPTATLSEVAQRVGISTRTMTRRYSALIDSLAVWFVPIFDFRAISYPLVALRVGLRPETDGEHVVRQVTARFPLTLTFRDPLAGLTPRSEVNLFVMPPSAAHLEDMEQFVSSIKGVLDLEMNIMIRLHSFRAWFDQHLETMAPSPGQSAALRRRGRRR
jgi:DNA-binding Lrp family transcriptional regulator